MLGLQYDADADIADADAAIEINPTPASASISKVAASVETFSLKFDIRLNVSIIWKTGFTGFN